jgi:hypothetical protein
MSGLLVTPHKMPRTRNPERPAGITSGCDGAPNTTPRRFGTSPVNSVDGRSSNKVCLPGLLASQDGEGGEGHLLERHFRAW